MPSCRNCQKSKRECQGYDPVFKNAPGPAPIQPAPSSAPLASGVPTTAHPYGNQPHLLTGALYGTGSMAYDSAALGATGASHPYDYNSAIDPALEASAVPTTAAGTPYHQTSPGMCPHFCRTSHILELHCFPPFNNIKTFHLTYLTTHTIEYSTDA